MCTYWNSGISVLIVFCITQLITHLFYLLPSIMKSVASISRESFISFLVVGPQEEETALPRYQIDTLRCI